MSDMLSIIENQLNLCKYKNTYCNVNKEEYVFEIKQVCSSVKSTIISCKEFVYSHKKEINFFYYDIFKKEVSNLIEQRFLFEIKLLELGEEMNCEVEEFYRKISFSMSDFKNSELTSNNQKQSDDFNNFVSETESYFFQKYFHKSHSKNIINSQQLINPNLWDENCFELFKYLFDNYYDHTTKRKLTNIYHFLKSRDPKSYLFSMGKDEYKTYIKENYNISLTNFDKAGIKYEEKDLPSLKIHVINFEKTQIL